MLNKKRITGDFAYSLLASLVTTGVLQVVVYPVLAQILENAIYGELLTLMGIINTVSLSVGNTLNNTRLIQNNLYIEKSIEGDFNIILVFFSAVSSIAMAIVCIMFFNNSKITIIFIMILIFTMAVRSYYIVQYRIVLDFKKNLICSIIQAIGYIIGLLCTLLTNQWPLVFIVADVCAMVYLWKTSSLLKEPFKVTVLFNGTLNKFIILALATLSTNAMLYLDRLIIYPLLGAENVPIYTIASFFGKTLGVLIVPISAVLLGYFSQQGFKLTLSAFWKMNGAVVAVACCFILVSVIAAPLATFILYPSYFELAKPFILITNVAAAIGCIASMAQPAVLKFAPTYWQIIKEVIYAFTYLSLGIILTRKYGLIGFCYASIISNTVKVVVLYIMGSIVFSKNTNN